MEKIAFLVGEIVAFFDTILMPTSETPLKSRLDRISKITKELSEFWDLELVLEKLGNNKHVLSNHPCLNHRDIRFDNLIWIPYSEQVAVIDFDTCCWGMPGADLGRMLLEDFREPNLSEQVLLGYQSKTNRRPPIEKAKALYAIEMLYYLKFNRYNSSLDSALEQKLVEFVTTWIGGDN